MSTKIKILILGFVLTIFLGFVTFKATYCFMTIGDELVVSFNTMGGEEIKNITYTYGVNTLTNKLPTPEKEGYTFEGWYLEKEYNTQIKDVPYPEFIQDTAITLYAKWSVESKKENSLIIGIVTLLLVMLLLSILIISNKNKSISKKMKVNNK